MRAPICAVLVLVAAALAAGCGSSPAGEGAGTSPVAGEGAATITIQAPAEAGRRNQSSTSAARPPSRRTPPREVLVIGDSLAVGMQRALKAALSGWRVHVDARIGRTLGEGMSILERQPSPPAILAFSLFTNDGPRDTPALEAAVSATAARQGGCAVWATIVRPPLDGVSYEAANRLLRRLAEDPELTLQLVDWAAAVAQSPALLARDGVHATRAGYRVLARLYAAAIRSCAKAG